MFPDKDHTCADCQDNSLMAEGVAQTITALFKGWSEKIDAQSKDEVERSAIWIAALTAVGHQLATNIIEAVRDMPDLPVLTDAHGNSRRMAKDEFTLRAIEMSTAHGQLLFDKGATTTDVKLNIVNVIPLAKLSGVKLDELNAAASTLCNKGDYCESDN